MSLAANASSTPNPTPPNDKAETSAETYDGLGLSIDSLTGEQWQSLLATTPGAIDTSAPEALTLKQNRLETRYAGDRFAHVIWHLPGDGEDMQHFEVECDNISPGGIALLHSCSVPMYTPCSMTAFTIDGRQLLWTGRVAHCTDIAEHGKVSQFRIGVTFDYAIDVSRLVPKTSPKLNKAS